MIVPNGSTDVTTYFVLRDSTNHAPKTDVTITDIDLYYVEELTAISSKVDATALDAANSAHADNKAYHVGQGMYRIDWPDAAFDSGVGKKVTLIVVCTGVDTTFLEVELSPHVTLAATQGSYAPAKAGDAMTLTAAYDAAKTAASQTSVTTIDDFLDTEIAAILADTNELQTDLVNGGRLDLLVDGIKAKTDLIPASPAAIGSAMTITDSTTLNSIADAVLKRDWTEITGEATRSLLNAARSLLNKWTLTTGSAGYVVKKEDDSTTAWTGTPTVDGNGNVSGMDHD